MNIRTWLPIRNSCWLFSWCCSIRSSSIQVPFVEPRSRRMATSPTISSAACCREASGSSRLMSAPERPMTVRVLRDREDLAGGGALDDGQREALVRRQLEQPHAGGRRPPAIVAAPAAGRPRGRGWTGVLLRAEALVRPRAGGRAAAGGAASRREPRPGPASTRRRGAGVLDLDRAAALRAARLDLGPVAQLGLVEPVRATGSWGRRRSSRTPPLARPAARAPAPARTRMRIIRIRRVAAAGIE